MGLPIPSGTPANLFLSSAAISLDGVDVGLVSGVKVNVKHEVTEGKSDQFGKSVINHFYVGDSITIEMMLDEITAPRFRTAYPHAALVTSGGAARVTWGKPVGQDFFSLAKQLVIQPTADDTAYSGRRFTFYKAIPVGDSALEYGPDKKMQIKVTLTCYPDATQPNGEWYGYFGDAAAGSIIHASAAAAVAGGGNVGNGTVGSIIVNDSFTKTETWTLTCIAAIANSGLFSVVGSVTGARGVATVGSSYTSNVITPSNSEIGFLISDGATDFAVGDTFTIATTAKSYV